MKDEQMKMVLDALTSLGEGAREAFFWWLFFDKALPVIGWLVFAGIAAWTLCFVIRKCA